MSGNLPHLVKVKTTARLHMGFLDMHGGLGRRFGSIGLSLESPATLMTARRADDFSAAGPSGLRAVACARMFAERVNFSGGVHLTVEEHIPEHAGLGSGTQMALAVGVAMTRLYGLPFSLNDIAAMTERGARSGIGIGTFTQGGLLVDAGRGASTVVPPVIARMDFPEDWRILLIFDHSGLGVHGDQEVDAFRNLPEFPADFAGELCRRVLMQALPAIAERDLTMFGEAIHAIQCRVGDHFAAAQGGGRYTSPSVSGVLEWISAQGVGCIGQSSWGPTGFAVLGSEVEAQRMLAELELRYLGQGGLSFMVTKARNQASEVQVICENNALDAACAAN
jgi:beta-RFAP synthase